MTPCCTSLDHLYPSTVPGTPCYCGARTWAGAPRLKRLCAGTVVNVAGHRRLVVERLRGENVYRVDRPAGGRILFDRDELVVSL